MFRFVSKQTSERQLHLKEIWLKTCIIISIMWKCVFKVIETTLNWLLVLLLSCPDRQTETFCRLFIYVARPLPLFVWVYLISSMLLQLFVELQRDADHHFCLVSIGVGDVVQDAIKIYTRDVQKCRPSGDSWKTFLFKIGHTLHI